MSLELTIDKTEAALRVRAIVDDVHQTPILDGAMGEVVLDLEAASKLNSAGVRQWVRFVYAIPADVAVHLERCPAFFLRQVVMIGNFLGQARMRTLYLLYTCVDLRLVLRQARVGFGSHQRRSAGAACMDRVLRRGGIRRDGRRLPRLPWRDAPQVTSW